MHLSYETGIISVNTSRTCLNEPSYQIGFNTDPLIQGKQQASGL